MKTIRRYLSQHIREIIKVSLCLGIILLILIIPLTRNYISIFFKNLFTTTEATSAGVTGLGTLIAATAAVWQLRKTSKYQEQENTRKAVREAVDVAKIFQRDLIGDMIFIMNVYNKIGLTQYLAEKITTRNTYTFDGKEARRLFGDRCFATAKTFYDKINAKIIDEVALTMEGFQVTVGSVDKDSVQLVERNKKSFFENKVSNTLNTLEWIAMLFNTNAADDMVIFQSLHQTLLPFIRSCYFEIAAVNIENSDVDRFYWNITKLFCRWTELYAKLKKKETKRAMKKARKKAKEEAREQQREANEVGFNVTQSRGIGSK
jgi:hypothetical protein